MLAIEDGSYDLAGPFGAKVKAMRRWAFRLVILALVVAAIWVAQSYLLRPKPVEVRTVEVGHGTVEQTVTNTRAGTVKARLRTRMSPEYGGNAVEIPFREGDWVEKGSVVLRIDDSLQRARLDLSTKELAAAAARQNQACASAERARRETERMRRLAEEEIVSADVLDEVRSMAESAAAACDASRSDHDRARSAVGLARVELEKTVLRAPFSGVLAEVSVEIGEWASPSPPALPIPPVIDLLDPTSIYISAPMDETDSAQVKEGQPVRVTVDSHRGQEFPGRVTRVAVFVLDLEAQNRTVEIEVELDDRELAAQLRPGTSADVEVLLETREDVLRVPSGALIEGNKVLVVDGEQLSERQLEIGLKNWNFTEVQSGVDEGDLLVVSLDRPEIKAGALVATPEAAPSASP